MFCKLREKGERVNRRKRASRVIGKLENFDGNLSVPGVFPCAVFGAVKTEGKAIAEIVSIGGDCGAIGRKSRKSFKRDRGSRDLRVYKKTPGHSLPDSFIFRLRRAARTHT